MENFVLMGTCQEGCLVLQFFIAKSDNTEGDGESTVLFPSPPIVWSTVSKALPRMPINTTPISWPVSTNSFYHNIGMRYVYNTESDFISNKQTYCPKIKLKTMHWLYYFLCLMAVNYITTILKGMKLRSALRAPLLSSKL